MKSIGLFLIMLIPSMATAGTHYDLILSTNSKQVKVSLHYVIKAIYPDAISDPFGNTGFTLQDDSDGKGTYIRFWNYERLQPTKTEIKTRLSEGYALQIKTQNELIEKLKKMDAKWSIAKSTSTTESEKIQALIEMEKLRRGEE